MRTISIVLNDNDFGNTFTNLLETVMRVINYKNKEVTEEFIREIIIKGAVYHYILFDNSNNEDLEHIEKYFSKNMHIYFDEEAEKDILNTDHDSGAWYLEVITGKVYSY